MVRSRGTTLLELVVVMLLFVIILAVIVGFEVYASQVTTRQGKISDNYRRVVTMLDKLETDLANAQIYLVQADSIVYGPLLQPQVVQNRWPSRANQAVTLAIKKRPVAKDDFGSDLVQINGGQQSEIMAIKTWETLSFAMSADGQYVTVSASGSPPLNLGPQQGAPFQLTRSFIIENAF